MPYNLIETKSEEEFTQSALSFLVKRIQRYITDCDCCTLELSGGSTPRQIYTALGHQNLDWSKVSLCLVDERYTNAKSENSNQQMIRETLLKNAQIPQEQVLFPNTSLPLEECMQQYTEDLRRLITDYLPHVAVLGMGEDGHIASLFPPVSELALEDQRFVVHTETDSFDIHDRISVALNFIANAQEHLFLLKGEGKKRVWEQMLASNDDDHRWPAKRVLESKATTVISLW